VKEKREKTEDKGEIEVTVWGAKIKPKGMCEEEILAYRGKGAGECLDRYGTYRPLNIYSN
jgi:hypothetical protein